MRCIEMSIALLIRNRIYWLIETWDVLKSTICWYDNRRTGWLIETWDVLKYFDFDETTQQMMINRNMRCIEIGCACEVCQFSQTINRNMRCIEIMILWQIAGL